jgi:hypothetical protein
MIFARRLEPEWLDELPAGDPRAIRSRCDLKRINAVMLQTFIMARLLKTHCADAPPKTVVELGAGDGTFMLALARRMASRWPCVKAILVDRQNIVTEQTRAGFRALQWRVETVSADVLDFLEAQKPNQADIVTANLFLHHFPARDLVRLFAHGARLTPTLVACEPRRSAAALLASRLVFAIGCNDVSRHDAVASVHAGFCGTELSALWPRDAGWILHEHGALPFTHCFVARYSG